MKGEISTLILPNDVQTGTHLQSSRVRREGVTSNYLRKESKLNNIETK